MTAYTITTAAETRIAETLGKDISMATIEVVPEAILVYEGRLVHAFDRNGNYFGTHHIGDEPNRVYGGDWDDLDA